ncbi:MAG TPA: hypothetical protein VKS79_12425 [Gemmataceae bacterium]|nr:hypothetical protein [Gemmataceae bacterium]
MATVDDDGLGAPPAQRSGLDKWFTDQFVFAIIISICCNGLCLIPLIINFIGFFTCKDPKAKNNAMICLIISVVLTVLGLGLRFSGVIPQQNFNFGK